MTGRPRVVLAVMIVVTAALATVIFLRSAQSNPAGPIPLPAPRRASPPATPPVVTDFVGAEVCSECHAEQYNAWKGSTHGRAGGQPTKDRVIAPFDGVPMTFKDALVTPSVTPDGAYLFTVAQRDRPVRAFRVDAVVGGGLMEGGGTQAYFSGFPDGTLRFLPFDYSKGRGQWFCSTIGRIDRGWVPITPELALADCDDWPPNRVLGNSDRFVNCQQCHGSQIEIEFDSNARRYQTRYTTLAINCESCHGPGRRHVEIARSGRIASTTDIGLRPLATLTKDDSLRVCFQCHAVKSSLQAGYLPGKGLEDHFALKLPAVSDGRYLPDGRTRTFAYQEGHLASDCYVNGSMTCVDCHEPHGQRYRDVNGVALTGRFDNGQCLGCHPSKAEPIERHTHHPPASAGSRCVSCHMPYLQQPEVGPHIPYGRSDHTIPIPRPLYDRRVGLESACQQCHRDRTVEQLQAQVSTWYGTVKPHPESVTATLDALNTPDPRNAAQRALAVRGSRALTESIALADVLSRYAIPDAPVFDPATIDRLKRRATGADPDIQALALATLHLARGADPGVRTFLAERLRALGPRERAVRDRWGLILTFRGDSYLTAGDARSAVLAYERAAEIKPEDASIARALGLAYMQRGTFGKATESLKRGLVLAPDQSQTMVGLGIVLMQEGDVEGAMKMFRAATTVNPWDPSPFADLGMTLLRRGDAEAAFAPLERAVALDPSLANAQFMLANAYAAIGRLREAAEALERGLEFAPGDADARRMLDRIRAALDRQQGR